jgi:hypothetical protein
VRKCSRKVDKHFFRGHFLTGKKRVKGETMLRTVIFLLWNIFLLYMAIVVNVWLGFMLLGMSALAVFAIVYSERDCKRYWDNEPIAILKQKSLVAS